jgi:hypothetical protein
MLGGNCSIKTIHGANNGKFTKTTESGTKPGIGTQASSAASATANKPVIGLDNIDGSSSKKVSDGRSDDDSSLGSSSL